MLFRALIALILATSVWAPAHAGATACGTHYLSGEAPEITNTRMVPKARELCFAAFGVMHSGIARTPLWSAEHLTRSRLAEARRVQRVDTFHPEDRLPAGERAELADYARSGFDRGHMAPSADMPSRAAQQESFSLANILPQNPDNNRNLWEGIEAAVRKMAKERGDLYVISGPLFVGESVRRLNGRVLVPSNLFKVVYDPKQGEAAAYVVANEATSSYSTMSVAELEAMSGINFFPRMPLAVKQTKLTLPAPIPRHSGGARAAKGGEFVASFPLRAQRAMLR